jgi:heavy metal translocating P-type ATPase
MADPRNPQPSGHTFNPAMTWVEGFRIAFVALAAGLVGWHPPVLAAHLSGFGWASILIGGFPIFAEAVQNLRQRRMTMELSMTLALVCAAAIGEFFTALVITLFVLVAEVLEGLTVDRGRHALAELLQVLPSTVRIRRGDVELKVDLDQVRIGDLVLVNPGGRLPVDGRVVAGHSFVDAAAITGEPVPVEKQAGDWVHAGSINQAGTLDVRTEGLGPDTTFGRIVAAVEQAERSRAPIQKLADRLAGYLVYFALACAAITWLVTGDLRSTISVIIVAGACGIAAGTPLAVLGGIGRCARLGAIVKGGVYLEALGRIDTVVLDKTGTLTFGFPEVVAIQPEPGHTRESVLGCAAMAEKRSEHPLGGAILRQAGVLGLEVEEPAQFQALPGQGVRAVGTVGQVLVGNRTHFQAHGIAVDPIPEPGHPSATELLVALDGRPLGSVWVADRARGEARNAILALHAMGIHTLLLTGDAAPAAAALGKELGIGEVEADLLPEQKQERIAELRRQGRRVAMVGDGLNDAPALVEAEVGIAMGSGADVTREAADVVLIGDDLMKLVEALQVARRMRRVIRQNFTGTLAVDGVGVGLAAFGWLNPLLAAFIHVTSELGFILNATRLLPPHSKKIK